MNTRAGAALVAIALVAAGCTSGDADSGEQGGDEPGASDEPAPDDTDSGGEIAWEECEDGFECAEIDVPLDYSEPDGETIELALLRVPAGGDDPIGSLVVNPGGPGGSGIEYAMVAEQQFGEAVRDHFHIVGFDPRGVADSTPIDCVDDAELDDLLAADPVPDDAAELEQTIAETGEFGAACEARSGELLEHIGTENVARDLDVIRSMLGDDVLYYFGASYGTYIGAIYADLFPERVGRLVLDGAMDPSLSSVEFSLGQTAGIERALNAYIADCVDSGDCPLGSTEREAYDTLAGLLDVIDDEPLPASDPERPLTQSLAFYGVILPLYVPPAEGYPALTLALDQALAGSGEMLLRFADLYLQRNPDGTYVGNQNEVIGAVHCIDRPNLQTVEEVEAVLPQFEEASPIFGPITGWGELGCAEWPVEPVSEPAPVTAAGAAPILVVGTTGDHATPYAWAESLAGQLESGVLLTYQSFGHTAYRTGSDCIDGAVDTYLVDGEVPVEGDRVCS